MVKEESGKSAVCEGLIASRVITVNRYLLITLRKNLGILLLALVFAILGVIIHECGHYLAALACGFRAQIHFAGTTVSPRANAFVIAAGPGVNALCISAGSIWLWYLRRNRRQEPASMIDWVSTLPILYAARWLYNLSRPNPYDEEVLSVMAGLPGWALPYFLGAIALAIVTWVIRLHSAGGRLFPFCATAAGFYLGVVLWIKLLGPRVLP